MKSSETIGKTELVGFTHTGYQKGIENQNKVAIQPNSKMPIIYLRIPNKKLLLSLVFLIKIALVMSQTLQTVPKVDLEKYAGKWYEIASFPQRFQKGCTGTTAEYTFTDKGYVIVENRCFKDSLNGKQSYIKGKAFVVENSGNAKLKVQFFGLLKANTGL